jgi:uncharacterized damage-inducible protein DinB
MKRACLAILVVAFSSPASAQSEAAQGETVAGVKWIYDSVKSYLTRSAEQMAEEDYAFRPTPEVRTFGQQLGHIINSHYNYCSTVLGEANPSRRDAEEITAKAELVAALRESFAYCDRAYAIPDARATEQISLYGAQRPRFAALAFNASHDFEHYGNIVTYMRIKGMVPPSSQRGGGN